ncbi:carboxypeptidase B-like [Dendronephthya gigantea]|uniref:carboxypeptidase B-like n=1 Tax=Dendronephthya gigantea TaxID=151771 RepID=UPI00106C7123|nr:carboxypeptidase B-like [Dendronephthya gigantea]
MLVSVLLLAAVSMAKSNPFYGDYYEGDQVLRVTPDTESKVQDVMKIHKVSGLEKLDSWMPTFRPNHPADFYAKKSELPIIEDFLTNKSIPYRILIRNVTKAIWKQRTTRRRNRYKMGEYDYQKFHPLAEIHRELEKLGREYANISEILNLGRSHEGREMKAIKILGRSKRSRKIFFIECGTHAREWLSPATCMWLIKTILKDRRSEDNHSKRKEKMCNRIDWVIVPVINVDGYAYSWTKTGRFWRKNRRRPINSSDECIGIDLNRNWGYKWGGNGSSNDPCSSSYRGTAPFSEIETRNVAKYLYRNRCNLLGYIGLHSYSQFWMTPWGYKTELPEHYNEMKRVADVAIKAIKMAQGATYKEPGPSSEVIYSNTGSAKDWTYGVLHVQYSYGIELRPSYDGKYGFLVPADQIRPSGEEIVAAIKSISTVLHLYEGRRLLNSKPSSKTHNHKNEM